MMNLDHQLSTGNASDLLKQKEERELIVYILFYRWKNFLSNGCLFSFLFFDFWFFCSPFFVLMVISLCFFFFFCFAAGTLNMEASQ